MALFNESFAVTGEQEDYERVWGTAMSIFTINSQTLQRLTLYLHHLRSLPDTTASVTAKDIAAPLNLEFKTVYQDLKLLLPFERAKTYRVGGLIKLIEQYVLCSDVVPAVVVGVGKLGMALMGYAGFTAYGLDVLAGFDVKPDIIRKGAWGKPVYSIDKLEAMCRQLNARIGIVCTYPSSAREACDQLIKAGVAGIWNFTSVRLTVPGNVLLIHEDMSGSLVRLANHIMAQKTAKQDEQMESR